MAPRTSLVIIQPTDTSIVEVIKRLADAHRVELGFHTRQSFVESLARRELLVAMVDGQPVGFARYHHTRNGYTTLQEIVTIPSMRTMGIGRCLVATLVAECQRRGTRAIRLSCPVELPANRFYQALGFRRPHRRSRSSTTRPLYQWELPVWPPRPLRFVASITSSASDLRRLLPLWEREGPNRKPFAHCIVTPLFIGPRTLAYVRYLRDSWGIGVWFDSGGFFVQQGKLHYEELFVRLLDFYCRFDWAEAYVLPDFVPTSRSTAIEIEERVRVTAMEGIRFFKRMPVDLRQRAIGVLQGHAPQHLRYCLDVFLEGGVRRLGFGSFDTGGVRAEINLLTQDAAERLETVRELISQAFQDGRTDAPADLHLFGVGSPNVLERFPRYRATSFDSSGWMRTAGYGNVYLPFQGRRNVTHGASAIISGAGLSAQEFYALAEVTQHTCPFCRDFSRLQSDRFSRMWHNAIVFDEMTTMLNAPMPAAEEG